MYFNVLCFVTKLEAGTARHFFFETGLYLKMVKIEMNRIHKKTKTKLIVLCHKGHHQFIIVVPIIIILTTTFFFSSLFCHIFYAKFLLKF